MAPSRARRAARAAPRSNDTRRRSADKPRRPATRLQRERAAKILDQLEQAHPEATCALVHRNAYELLVATILSAQCTDERVNQVTPTLFRRYPDAAALARADTAELEGLIRPTGFFRAKARSLVGCARALVERHGGEVPRGFDDAVKLPGVGRKTASVVLGHAFEIADGIAVDTHVLRVSNRLGMAKAEDAGEVEQQLMATIDRERWIRTTDLLIFHGRKICHARRPACGVCPVFALCRWDQRQAYALAGPPRAPRAPERPPRSRPRP